MTTRQSFPDQLRGIALLGIVLVNAPFLAISAAGYSEASVAAGWDRVVAFLVTMLAAGKLANGQFPIHAYVTAGAATQTGNAPRSSFLDIFRGGLARRTVAVGVASWMTFGAQLSVLTLMPTILVAQGYSITKSFTFTIIMQSGSLLGALAASSLGYYFPRKRVLTAGAIAACLAGLAFGNLTSNVAMVLMCGAPESFADRAPAGVPADASATVNGA